VENPQIWLRLDAVHIDPIAKIQCEDLDTDGFVSEQVKKRAECRGVDGFELKEKTGTKEEVYKDK
jgi:hypothetical protein